MIRELWRPGGRPVRADGVHYRYTGAKAGPAPAHATEIWLGALKPRMLALTGRKADGWLPSSSFIPPRSWPGGSRIEEGAASVGRDPGEIRRLYNISGSSATAATSCRGGRRTGSSSSSSWR